MQRPMIFAALAVMVFCGAPVIAVGASDQAWLDRSLSPEKRAAALVTAMRREEKFQQLKGAPGIVPELPQCYGARHVPAIARLRIPTLRITNGPVGIGHNDCAPPDTPNLPRGALNSPHAAKATSLPAAIAMAASFDPHVAAQFGDVMGSEARALALQVLEAPGINMARSPRAGRNFEYFGEDPFLTGTMAVAEIKAVQSHGVIAMAKHIVANEQETDRTTVNEEVAERPLHEIYLLPFEMAVKQGDVAALMCSYNIVNGAQMCENKPILTGILRGQWGFKGFVQSDFFAAQSLGILEAGMDLEMPGFDEGSSSRSPRTSHAWLTPNRLGAALASGEIAQSDIDQALSRRYVQMFRLGIFDRPIIETPIAVKDHAEIAAQIGTQTAVLLKNDGNRLPFHAKTLQRVVLVGKADYAAHSVVGGGGSSAVIPFNTVSPLDGVKRSLAELGSPARVELVIVDDENRNLGEAVSAAKSADAVIVLAGSLSAEGADLPDTALPKQQDAMISAVAAANPRTVVVLKSNAAVLMPWADRVPAIMEAWFPGQEDGRIVARLLFGQANPSGKLPVTFPRAEADLPAHTAEQFPGVIRDGQRQVRYSEGLEIGYRWFDARKIEPLYPFGYGLSYTSFALGEFRSSASVMNGAKPLKVSFSIRNTGKMAGAEVAQIYLAPPAESGEPPKRLIGFQKVFLAPGAQKTVKISIDPGAASHPFSRFRPDRQAWELIPGRHHILLGTSSRNILASADIEVIGSR